MKKSNNKQVRKSTKAEVELRVAQVVKLILTANSKDSIVHYSSLHWNVGLRQTSKYIKLANERITQAVQKDIDLNRAIAVLRYEELYNVNMNDKDYKTAITALDRLTNIQGLLKTQIEHSGEVKFISNIPD